MTIIRRNIRILGICLLPLLAFSCSDMDTEQGVGRSGQPNLTFNMTRASQDIINNTEVYQFETNWNFKQRILGVSPGTDKLSMEMAAGSWNLALVTADTDISSRIISPVNGQARTGKLWETQSQGGELPSMPELRTSYIDHVNITANQPNTAGPAVLFRNVALVKVVIDKTRGLDESGTHSFELKDVPTTLNWAGGLYPNKDNPDVSVYPMKGAFTIKAKQGEVGIQDSDTLNFIIPAHKGTDYIGAHNDTTTHTLKLSVDLACLGGTRFQKADVEIPRVPRVNGILLVKLSMIGQLEVDAEILDWKDVSLNADLSQTQLMVDKAEVGLAYKDTVYVNTNASSFAVEKASGADWITSVNKIGNNAVEIIANVDTYVDNQPRSSYITITANNVTKKIPVTQRPDRGTISVDNKRLVFCPKVHEKRSVIVNTIGGDWKFITQTYKATPNIQQGSNGTNLTFTRASTLNDDDFDKYYGDSIIVVKNIKTLDTDTISIVNCFIYMYDNTINANAPSGTQQNAVTVTSDLVVYGGNRNLRDIMPVENWIYNVSWNPTTQQMTLTTDREPDDEARDGSMSFAHAECPDYIVTATIHQDIIVTIPPFQYFVLKYIWPETNGYDVDIAAEFINNGSTFDSKAVGWNLATTVNHNSTLLIQWGGDARDGQGETVFFNAPVIDSDVSLPRKVNLKTYATWFSPQSAKGTPMVFEMTAYKGGTMVKGTNSTGDFNNKNYYNQGGEMLYQQKFKVEVNTYQGNSSFRTGGYEPIATIVYDRIKHSASVTIHANTLPLTRTMPVNLPQSPDNEYRQEKAQTNKIVNTYSK